MVSNILASIDLLTSPSTVMALVFAIYFAGVYWLTHNCRGFWNDEEGWSMDELASILSLGLWIYVGINLALAGSAITEQQVDFFEVLTYLPLATVAKQAIMRFGWPSRRRSMGGMGGGYDPYGYSDVYNQPQPQGNPPTEP